MVRRFIPALAMALVLAVAAFGSAQAQQPDTLRILYVPSFTGHLPVLIAEDAGFFGRNGIKTELIGTNEAIKPILSGDADVMLPAPAVVVIAVSQGIGVKIVASVQSRITQALLVQPEIANAIPEADRSYPQVLQALKGKKIGVSVRGGSVDLNLRYLLLAGGLTPDRDVFVVPLGSGAAMVAAMRAKQVDGVLAFPPLSNQLRLDGTGVSIVDLAKGEGPPGLVQPFVVAAVLDSMLKDKPDVVARFVKALSETIDYIRDPNNRTAVTAIVAKRLNGLDPRLMDGIIDELSATIDTKITPAEIARVNEVEKALGVIKQDVPITQVLAPNLISQ